MNANFTKFGDRDYYAKQSHDKSRWLHSQRRNLRKRLDALGIEGMTPFQIGALLTTVEHAWYTRYSGFVQDILTRSTGSDFDNTRLQEASEVYAAVREHVVSLQEEHYPCRVKRDERLRMLRSVARQHIQALDIDFHAKTSLEVKECAASAFVVNVEARNDNPSQKVTGCKHYFHLPKGFVHLLKYAPRLVNPDRNVIAHTIAGESVDADGAIAVPVVAARWDKRNCEWNERAGYVGTYDGFTSFAQTLRGSLSSLETKIKNDTARRMS